jgi:hypothetical protein
MLRDVVSRYYRCLLCSADGGQAGRSQTDTRPRFLYRVVIHISNTKKLPGEREKESSLCTYERWKIKNKALFATLHTSMVVRFI